jgi:thioredoxin 2
MSEIIKCTSCGANNRVKTGAEEKAVCGRCKTPLQKNTKPIIVTDANFAAEVEKSPLPVLLDLWAAWCGPCRMIAPVIEQLAAELAGKCIVGKLDVDQNQRIAARFSVQSIPTLLILKNGLEVERLVGLQSKEAILRRLQNHL